MIKVELEKVEYQEPTLIPDLRLISSTEQAPPNKFAIVPTKSLW